MVADCRVVADKIVAEGSIDKESIDKVAGDCNGFEAFSDSFVAEIVAVVVQIVAVVDA